MLKSTFSEGIIIHELGGVGGEWFCVWLRGASWGSNELWTSFRGDYVISAKDVFVYVCVLFSLARCLWDISRSATVVVILMSARRA